MLLALIVNTIGFLHLLSQTFYTLHRAKVKGPVLENLLVRWVLLIIIILIDNVCLGIAEILPFGTYVYNYYKLMIFISKNDFYVSMMQKFIVKADPDVLGELFLTLIARIMIRIMHKSCMVLKKLNLPVSQTDFNLSQEIMEFLDEYHPRIIKTSTNLNNTSLLDQSMVDIQTESNQEKEKKKQEEKRKRQLEKQRREKILEDEIINQQQELLRLQQQKLQVIKDQFDDSDISDRDQAIKEYQAKDLIPRRDYSNDANKNNNVKRDQQNEVNKKEVRTSSKTKYQSQSQQPVGPVTQTKTQPKRSVESKKIEFQEEVEVDGDQQCDEDDIINNIDFNDSSSKQEDSSSNEKVYITTTTNNQTKQKQLLPDLLLEDDFEVLHQSEQTNFKDGDVLKKKEIISIKKSATTKPPISINKSATSYTQKYTTTYNNYKNNNNNNISSFGNTENSKLLSSVRENSSSSSKDNKNIYQEQNGKQDISPPSNKLDYQSSIQKSSARSKLSNNAGLQTTLSQTRNHLDETRTKFEQYKMKYSNNTRMTNSISLIDKDD